MIKECKVDFERKTSPSTTNIKIETLKSHTVSVGELVTLKAKAISVSQMKNIKNSTLKMVETHFWTLQALLSLFYMTTIFIKSKKTKLIFLQMSV